jgi:hypothetical protein
MKKIPFWLLISAFTFALGSGAYFILYLNQGPAVVELAPVQDSGEFDCIKPKDFPGRSQRISELIRGKNDYFPKRAFDDGWVNGDDSANKWYGEYLRAMKEVSLLNTTDENHEVYRFLWLRTFDHPVAVRIERDGRHSFRVVSEELTGEGGYGAGKILRKDNLTISKEQWCEFINLLEQAHFWTEPSSNDRGGLDGAQWVLEGVKSNRYHIVDRWSPENGKFRDACIHLLKLSGRDIDKLEKELY